MLLSSQVLKWCPRYRYKFRLANWRAVQYVCSAKSYMDSPRLASMLIVFIQYARKLLVLPCSPARFCEILLCHFKKNAVIHAWIIILLLNSCLFRTIVNGGRSGSFWTSSQGRHNRACGYVHAQLLGICTLLQSVSMVCGSLQILHRPLRMLVKCSYAYHRILDGLFHFLILLHLACYGREPVWAWALQK